MASNQTPHLKLCQWEEDDEVLRVDFNADNAKIDAAVAAIQTTTADELQAVRATAEVCYSPENKPYAVGTYIGNGASTRTISLGFTPTAVLVTTVGGDVHYWASGINRFYGGLTVKGAETGANGLRIVTGGFQVASGNSASNYENQKFNYIAFK